MQNPSAIIDNSDKRAQSRRKTFLGAKLVYGDTAITVDCLLKDISDSGARVRLPEGLIVPKRLWLIEPRLNVAREADVVWHQHPYLGLHFLKSENLNETALPYARILKQIWLETQPRNG